MTQIAAFDTRSAAEAYYILYFSDRLVGGTLGPLKRARYATVAEAVDQAHSLRHSSHHCPLEVRDQHDRLITCAMMGWRLSPLHSTAELTQRQLRAIA